ncbi:(Fe-S)-binding protein [Flammeovirga pacifica]|uniref:Fe-S oxidoreductase n=1 Tax=Flammeovirga pacifica TaxID=915059 RepID=A0A1S1YSC1_FLAPC|nr:(Fe-S)-binding protein [Flammeovirga pacifica]OHX63906.1 Fe-S oxidoreductase [Flammeovirga pacifica]
MKIGLFIPCYINQLYPQVGISTFQLLQQYGEVEYPISQTCCGQPMANSGCENDSIGAIKVFKKAFEKYDIVIGPSASCVLHLREHGVNIFPSAKEVIDKTYDLTEFLFDIIKIKHINATFPHKVALHKSCHGLRGMRLESCSERVKRAPDKQKKLLKLVDKIKLVSPSRADECCGFGGTFSVTEKDVSVQMGNDRLADYIHNGAEYITSGDMSCLMHLEGLIKRQKLNIKVIHMAEILASNKVMVPEEKEILETSNIH